MLHTESSEGVSTEAEAPMVRFVNRREPGAKDSWQIKLVRYDGRLDVCKVWRRYELFLGRKVWRRYELFLGRMHGTGHIKNRGATRSKRTQWPQRRDVGSVLG